MGKCTFKNQIFSAKEGQVISSLIVAVLRREIRGSEMFSSLAMLRRLQAPIGVGELAEVMGKKSLTSADNKAIAVLLREELIVYGNTRKRSFCLTEQAIDLFNLYPFTSEK